MRSNKLGILRGTLRRNTALQAGVATRQITKYVDEHGRVMMILKTQVEGEAQGEQGPMAKFIAEVQKGPRHSNVTNFTQKDADVVEGESSFKVTR